MAVGALVRLQPPARWAALKAFGLSEEDASEHALQIAGTVTRPEPDTHIGTLVHCPDCAIVLDLVAIERINGAPEYDHDSR